MATNFLWSAAGTVQNLLTTELNSLASGSGTAFGPEITPAGYTHCDLLFKLASSSSALTAASYFLVYFVPTADGTNYPKYTSGASYKIAEQYLAATMRLHPATLSSEVIYEAVMRVQFPRAKFKTVLVSAAGVSLPSSGNTLDAYPYSLSY